MIKGFGSVGLFFLTKGEFYWLKMKHQENTNIKSTPGLCVDRMHTANTNTRTLITHHQIARSYKIKTMHMQEKQKKPKRYRKTTSMTISAPTSHDITRRTRFFNSNAFRKGATLKRRCHQIQPPRSDSRFSP